jgi:Uma2 family endonuclease
VRADAPLRDLSRRHPAGAEWFGLVVEVVSPRTRKTDRFLKPAEYAAAGIPCFWRVELEPEPVVHGFRLDAGRYEPTEALPVPWGRLEVDVAALLS